MQHLKGHERGNSLNQDLRSLVNTLIIQWRDVVSQVKQKNGRISGEYHQKVCTLSYYFIILRRNEGKNVQFSQNFPNLVQNTLALPDVLRLYESLDSIPERSTFCYLTLADARQFYLSWGDILKGKDLCCRVCLYKAYIAYPKDKS